MNAQTVDLGGPVHYLDLGGPADAPAVVYVHGLGGSHLNWSRLAPLLRGHVRGYAIDLGGFGLTPGADRRTTVDANAALLRRFLAEVVREPAVLMGNSMGGMVSILTAAGDPGAVRGLVLVDPTLPKAAGVKLDPVVRRQFAVQAVPGLGEWALKRRLATVPARTRISYVLGLCFSDPARIAPDLVDAGVDLEERRAGQPRKAEAYLEATRSILRGLGRPTAYWAKMASLPMPVLLVHGVHDRLVPIGNARAAAQRFPHWRYAELDAGHTPHMETPDEVAALVIPWLAMSLLGEEPGAQSQISTPALEGDSHA